MSRDNFQLVYDGSDIHDGEMDVFALAPALVAMGELSKAADSVLNGSDTAVTTTVKADFREGSFEKEAELEEHNANSALEELDRYDVGLPELDRLCAAFDNNLDVWVDDTRMKRTLKLLVRCWRMYFHHATTPLTEEEEEYRQTFQP